METHQREKGRLTSTAAIGGAAGFSTVASAEMRSMKDGKPENISALRKRMAADIAAILSGVMAITSAALAVQPGELSVTGAVAGALLIGLVAMMTRMLNDQTKKRAELGRRLRWSEWGGMLEVSAMALVYPVLTAFVTLLGPFDGWSWAARINAVFYFGIATVFAAAFVSSYLVERQFRTAGREGLSWAALVIMLTIVKKLT